MAKEAKQEEKKAPIIVIKKITKAAGHHGGAWKVAYADFVTAMMAFFLLLWLLNVTTDEERNAISNYFDPTHPKVSESVSGAGGLMGGLSMTPEGAMATTVQNITLPQNTRPSNNPTMEKVKDELRKKEEEEFKKIEKQIKEAIKQDQELASLEKNLKIDITPEGLRIQIVDQDKESMFPSGSAVMYEKTHKLMTKVAEIIKSMPNKVSIRGHTDSIPYAADAQYTNWELSADRANASRRVLLETGMPPERLHNVMGKADTEHLVPDNPSDPQNRRISIILLKDEITNPNFEAEAAKRAGVELPASDTPAALPPEPIGTFRKTPGAVEFP
jgi:chemotaxis protein MotB